MRESTSYTVHYTFYTSEQELALRRFLKEEGVYSTYIQLNLSHRLTYPMGVSRFIKRVEKHGGRVLRVVEDRYKSETDSTYYNSSEEWRELHEQG